MVVIVQVRVSRVEGLSLEDYENMGLSHNCFLSRNGVFLLTSK